MLLYQFHMMPIIKFLSFFCHCISKPLQILAGDCSNDKFCVTDDDDEVCINLNVSAYDSNKLTVAVQGRRLSVEYSDGTDKNGITGRRFMHIFDMSKSVLLETVECLLLDTGILHIRMKKAKIQLNRKEIPIQKAATFMIFK